MAPFDLNEDIDTLHDLLVCNSNAVLELQQKDASFPPGQNGVYNQSMSPVRSTSMWLINILKAYEISGDERFADAANAAADYLRSDDVRPRGYTFLSRTEDGASKCNGLIGQATPIRALVRAGDILDRPELIDSAVEVFSLHPFDEELGLWEAVEIDGEYLSFDRTFNHQIIFAAGVAELSRHSSQAKNAVSNFLDKLDTNMNIHTEGLIKHYIRPPLRTILRLVPTNIHYWPLIWNEAVSNYYDLSGSHRNKELGYYPTIVSRLAQLKDAFPEHPTWKARKTVKAVRYLQSYLEIIEKNNFDYGATIPEFNLAFAWHVFFDPSEKKLGELIETAVHEHYDPENGLLIQNAKDTMLQSTSISHLVDLPNIDLR